MHPVPRRRAPRVPLFLPTLLACALGTLASAQDAEKPVIEGVFDDSGKPTSIVSRARTFEVRGRHLYSPPEDPNTKGFPGISATLDGKPLATRAASPTSLRFWIPADHPERKQQKLVIRTRGQRLSLILDVGQTKQEGEGQEELPPLDITRFSTSTPGAGLLFRVEGVARDLLIDGVKLAVTLRFRDQPVRTTVIRVEKGAFDATIGPFRKRAPVGPYSVDVEFTTNRQQRSILRDIAKKAAAKKDGTTLRSLPAIRRRAFVNVGGTGPGGQLLPTDFAPQNARVHARASETIALVERLDGELRKVIALASRVYFKAPGASSVDEARYKKWLEEKGHAKDRAAADALWKDDRFASSRGELDAAAYGKWVEETIHSALREELAAARRFQDETICPIDPDVDRHSRQALAQLLELTRPRELFDRVKAALPAAVVSPKLDLVAASGAQRRDLRQTLAALRHRIAPYAPQK